MALQLNLTTPDTVEHQEAYCKVIETNLNWLEKRGRVTLAFWHNQTARDGDNPAHVIKEIHISIQKGAQYEVDEEGQPTEEVKVPAFDTLFGATELDQKDKNPVKEVYDWVKTKANIGGLDFTKSKDVI